MSVAMQFDPASLLKHVHATLTPADIGVFPTGLMPLPRLGDTLGLDVFIKRDDLTGMEFGGNKVRQLRFYLARAQAENADTILITGAVQSNFARTAAALARQLGMEPHVQLEQRVKIDTDNYAHNGNVLLEQILGATLHHFAEGENEAAADQQLAALADKLRAAGKRPYVIPLGVDSRPYGALGYIEAAIELAQQVRVSDKFDQIIVASGSALTHAGLLTGLRLLGIDTPVAGICVRRAEPLQTPRVVKRCQDIAELLTLDNPVCESDVCVYDDVLGESYGLESTGVSDAIKLVARTEGIFLDPVYTGKTMAGLIKLNQDRRLAGKRVLFWHTGGQAALFAYDDKLGI